MTLVKFYELLYIFRKLQLRAKKQDTYFDTQAMLKSSQLTVTYVCELLKYFEDCHVSCIKATLLDTLNTSKASVPSHLAGSQQTPRDSNPI